MLTESTIKLQRADAQFGRVAEVYDLILRAFAYMDGRIDPPSSATRLTHEALRMKCAEEIAVIALAGNVIVGCVFLAEKADYFHLSKFAVDPACHRMGIGRQMISEAERIAVAARKPMIELQTRVELTDNQTAFARMGFVETGRTAHAGYDRPTTVTMRKLLS